MVLTEDSKGGPETAAVNTTWQWYVYCLLQFQEGLWNCQQSIPHNTVMWYCLLTVSRRAFETAANNTTWSLICGIVWGSFRPSFETVFSQYHMTVICGIVCCSFRPSFAAVNTIWQWYGIVCCSFRPSFAVLSQYHMTVIWFIVCCSFRPSFAVSQ